MKKILTHLTGIVFVITILVAGGCKQVTKDNAETTAGNERTALEADSKDVDIFLKEILIDGRMHLEMYDSRDTLKIRVDSLYTLVYPGSTVNWKKAAKSNVKAVHNIRPTEDDGNMFSNGVTMDMVKGLYTLVIPDSVGVDTVKYEIVFTVKMDGEDEKETTWCIDPYLRIPDFDE